MKKLFAIFTATMLVCGLCVAPAYAIGDFVGGWEFDFDLPEEPGDYEFHFYTTEPGSDPSIVPVSDPEDLVIADEPIDNPAGAVVSKSGSAPAPLDTSNAADEDAQVGYPVQTGDHLGDMDSVIAITITVCLAAIFLALCRKFEGE